MPGTAVEVSGMDSSPIRLSASDRHDLVVSITPGPFDFELGIINELIKIHIGTEQSTFYGNNSMPIPRISFSIDSIVHPGPIGKSSRIDYGIGRCSDSTIIGIANLNSILVVADILATIDGTLWFVGEIRLSRNNVS